MSGIESVEWGLRHEPAIAQAVMDRTGRHVTLSEEFSLYRAADKPHYQASPDAFQKRKDRDDPGTLQIKTAMFFKREDWVDEQGTVNPPTYHKIQVLGEMRATGLAWGSLVCLIGGNRLIGPFDFDRNDAFLAASEPHLDAFWKGVLEHVPPPIDDAEATADVIKAMYPKDSGKSIELGPEWVEIVDQWEKERAERKTAEKAMKAIKSREDALKMKLAAMMGDALIGLLPDGRQLVYPTRSNAGYTVEPFTYRVLDLK